ncbi:MAG: hypothetical protein KAR13_13865, partial [Desulfobulbaceae bacterium]|nr:hypothetical protein [Desulfobulbaceae bacterium]
MNDKFPEEKASENSQKAYSSKKVVPITTKKPDSNSAIYKYAASLFSEQDSVIELRVLREGVPYFGFFDNPEALIVGVKKAEKYIDKLKGIFVTFNLVSPDLINDPSRNRLKFYNKYEDKMTKDVDIISINWLVVDIDRKVTNKDSATDKELKQIRKVKDGVADWFDDKGWPKPIIVMSGNGYHIYYMLPGLPNEKKIVDANKAILAFLDDTFGNENVSIDQAVANPARLMKFPGTMALKGENTEERPHRRSVIESIPDKIDPVSEEDYWRFVKEFATPFIMGKTNANSTAKPTYNSSAKFDVAAYCSDKDIKIKDVKVDGDKTIHVLECCLFNPKHRKKDAAIIQFADGKVGYKCFHNSCRDKTWKDVLAKFESCEPWFTDDEGKRGAFIPSKLVDYIQQEYKIINSDDAFYQYKDGVWRTVHRDHPQKITDFLLGDETSQTRINNAFKVLSVRRRRGTDEFNTTKNLINCKNGMLDIKTWELLPHSPEYYSTIQMPVNYDPDAKCRRFLRFLREIELRKSERIFLRKFLGAALS